MAEAKRYAVVNDETGEVVNSVLWDGESKWTPPEGHSLIQHDQAGPGGRFEGDEYIPPVSEDEGEEGASAVEYAIMLLLVFVVVVAIVTALGIQVSDLWSDVPDGFSP